ncbi:MAG: hypothetical protein ACOY3K_02750, partial [Candidatus Omnitrophota bacterium]
MDCNQLKRSRVKVTALITASLFLVMDILSFPSTTRAQTSAPALEMASAGSEARGVPGDLRIDPRDGTLVETFKGTSGRTAILLQDAHAIPDAQLSIHRLLGYFRKQYGVRTVAVEGAASELDPGIFRSFPDKERLKEVLRALHEKGELTGVASAAIFLEEGMDFAGVEDWKLYEEGLRLYQEAMKAGPEIGAILKQEAQRQEAEKKSIYNEKLYAIDQALEAFHGDHANLLETLKTLAAVKRPAKGSELEVILKEGERAEETSEKDRRAGWDNQNSRRAGLNKQDDSRAGLNKQDDSRAGLNLPYKGVSTEVEVKQLAARILTALKALPESKEKQAKLARFNAEAQKFSTGQVTAHAYGLFLQEVAEREKIALDLSSHLAGLIGDARRMRDIKGTRFFDAFEAYARSVKASLYKNEEEKNLDKASEELSLAKRFAALELSREDWKRVRSMEFGAWRHALTQDKTPNAELPTPDLLKAHFAFYQNAEARDEAFFKNIVKLMGKEARSPEFGDRRHVLTQDRTPNAELLTPDLKKAKRPQ